MAIAVSAARGPGDIGVAGDLFREYADWLRRTESVCLAFQNFEEELAGLPGLYAPPRGEILLARDGDGKVVGCIAVRPHDLETAEIKRLYVRPAGRGRATGRRLIDAALDVARRAGYRRAVLDTFPSMAPALRLYEAAGFVDVAAYYDNPIPGARYLGRSL